MNIKITTTPTFEGKKISEYLDIVFGEVVLSTTMSQGFKIGFTSAFGGRSETYEDTIVEARDYAIEEMKKRALKLKADAIVGVKLDYEDFGGMVMITVSGTAVRLEE